MIDKVNNVINTFKELTKTKGGVLILGMIIGVSPCVYVIHFQHLEIENLKNESDCIDKLIIQEQKMDKLKEHLTSKKQ